MPRRSWTGAKLNATLIRDVSAQRPYELWSLCSSVEALVAAPGDLRNPVGLLADGWEDHQPTCIGSCRGCSEGVAYFGRGAPNRDSRIS